MKNTGWRDIAELIGITAIVASLIFVGLQLRQSQHISMSAANQARTSDSIALRLISLESPALRSALAKSWGMADGEMTTDEKVAFGMWFWAELIYLENNHYQYVNGFITEEQWQSNLPDLRRMFSDPIHRSFWDGSEESVAFSGPFMKVIEEVIQEVDSQN